MPRRKDISNDLRQDAAPVNQSGMGQMSFLNNLELITLQKRSIHKWKTFKTTAKHPNKFTPRSDRAKFRETAKNPNAPCQTLQASVSRLKVKVREMKIWKRLKPHPSDRGDQSMFTHNAQHHGWRKLNISAHTPHTNAPFPLGPLQHGSTWLSTIQSLFYQQKCVESAHFSELGCGSKCTMAWERDVRRLSSVIG